MATFSVQQQTFYAYARSVFEHPSIWYDFYQENGTKYIKSRRLLEEKLQLKLNACVGEIFLSGIPRVIKAEEIAEIAALVGEVYILRFKVNFSGDSRGFAYLQYINPALMPLAVDKLRILFCQYSLPMVRVSQSRNSSNLLLKKIYGMSPAMVYETLISLINFKQLVCREISLGYFEYQITFQCNEEAVRARRALLQTILKFGRNAIIMWETKSPTFNNYNGGNNYKWGHIQKRHTPSSSQIKYQVKDTTPQINSDTAYVALASGQQVHVQYIPFQMSSFNA